MPPIDRREEILQKKAKLAEIKRQREERQKEFSATRQSLSALPTASKTSEQSRKELEDLVSSLIDRPKRDSGHVSPAHRGSRPSSILSSDQLSGEDGARPQVLSTSTQTLSTASLKTVFEVVPDPPSKRQVETYSKSIQTGPELWSEPQRRGSEGDLRDGDVGTPRSAKGLSRRERERDEELRASLRKEVEEELKATRGQPIDGPIQPPPSQPRYPLRQLHPDELNAVTTSDEFLSFVERSSKVIERALDEEYDVLADYGLSTLNTNGEDDSPYSRNSKKSHSLKQSLQLFDERLSRRRLITDIQFSSHFPELLLSSYTKNPSAPSEATGLVLLWNARSPSRPEYTFTATSDILSARFSPYHPNLVIGGSYSGQVLLWDTRASARAGQPVQKTPLSGSHLGHTHPVYSIDVVGTQNAHNVITASTDGIVCSWSFDMLSQPQELLELQTPRPTRIEDLAPTTISFPPSDPTFFLVGTEEGAIYPCHRYDRAGAKAGTDTRLSYRGHTAPIMSTHFHPIRGPVDLGDLMLSASLDWSVKLWRIKPAGASSGATTTTNGTTATTTPAPTATPAIQDASTARQEIAPILDIPREDCVYDARWHPTRPGVFACVLGSGDLEVFDINIEPEVPLAKAAPTETRDTVVGLNRGLNKCAWSEDKAGRIVATGGLDGAVTIFEVGKGFCGEGRGREEWVEVKKGVGRIEAGRI